MKPRETPFGRAFTAALAVLVCCAGLAACGTAGGAGGAPEDAAAVVTVPGQAAVPSGLTLTFADQNDQFRVPWELSGVQRSAPYKVKWATFSGGPPVLEAVKSGAADVGTVGENVLPIALANGPDREWVLIAAFASVAGGYYLAVHQDSGITKPADLRGKRVAYPQGTGRQVFVVRALEAAGLGLKDIQRVEVPGTEVGPVFSSGKVDAAALLGAQRFRSGNPRIIADGKPYGGALSVLVTRRSVLADPRKAAALGDFIKRSTAAANWTRKHSDALVDALYVKQQGLTPEQGGQLYRDEGPTTWRPIGTDVIAYEKEVGALLTKISITPRTDGQDHLFDDRYNSLITAQNKADGVTPPALRN